MAAPTIPASGRASWQQVMDQLCAGIQTHAVPEPRGLRVFNTTASVIVASYDDLTAWKQWLNAAFLEPARDEKGDTIWLLYGAVAHWSGWPIFVSYMESIGITPVQKLAEVRS